MTKTTKEWMHELNNEDAQYAHFVVTPIEPFKARAQFARALSLEEQGNDVGALEALDKAIEAEK